MKEIYEWVPWFKELSQKITEGDERYLVERAKTVAWKDDGTESALLKYGDSNIDPLSFFYTLASQSKGPGEPKQDLSEHRQRIRAVANARSGFG